MTNQRKVIGNITWGGAGVIVAHTKTEKLEYLERTEGDLLVISDKAKEIAIKFEEIKEIFNSSNSKFEINKEEFYGRIGETAKQYIENSESGNILLAIESEAAKMAIESGARKYFAYGSNMDVNQMKKRCPNSLLLGKGIAENQKFIINDRGVATIISSNNSNVEGLIWAIFENDESTLDVYEGVRSNLYTKEDILIQTKLHNFEALAYIATDIEVGVPRRGYLEMIIAAAKDFDFSFEYTSHLMTFSDTGEIE